MRESPTGLEHYTLTNNQDAGLRRDGLVEGVENEVADCLSLYDIKIE